MASRCRPPGRLFARFPVALLERAIPGPPPDEPAADGPARAPDALRRLHAEDGTTRFRLWSPGADRVELWLEEAKRAVLPCRATRAAGPST